MMPYMDPPPGFVPDQTTKQYLLYVKKQEKYIGHTKLPGLVQDSYYDITLPFFILAVVLELVGLFFILVEIPSIVYGLIGACALLLLDLLFAVWYHQQTKKICLCENYRPVLSLIVNDIIHRERRAANYESDMRRSKRIAFIPALLIVTIAVVKIITFYMLVSRSAGGIPETVVFFIIVSYAIVAFVHLRFTGYAVYQWRARRSWKKDEWKFNKEHTGGLQAQRLREHIVTREILKPSHAGNHKLEEIARVDSYNREVVLGASVNNEFQEYLRRELSLADGSVDNEVANRLKVDGGLHPDLRKFFTSELHINDDKMKELTEKGGLYYLEANGLLLDANLSELANDSIDTEARSIIALHGLKLQLDILGIAPHVTMKNGDKEAAHA